MRAIKRFAAAVFAVSIATGCATTTPPMPRPIPTIPIVHPAAPTPPAIDDVQWKVWRSGGDVWYVLSPADFERLMNNISGAAGFVEKQRNLIDFYRTSIDEHNRVVAESR